MHMRDFNETLELTLNSKFKKKDKFYYLGKHNKTSIKGN
jgi:hypothetical protein